MSDLILSANMALVVPIVNGQKTVFDMRNIYKAEARLIELCDITKAKAGELRYTFITAWSEASRYIGQLKKEVMRAKAKLRSVKAIVVLDRAPEELKRRGLSSSRSPAGSEDLRSAVVDHDKDYIAAEELVIEITASMAFMETKAETFKMAYFSVDRDEAPTRDTSGGTGMDEVGTMTQQEKIEKFVEDHGAIDHTKYDNTGFGPPKL